MRSVECVKSAKTRPSDINYFEIAKDVTRTYVKLFLRPQNPNHLIDNKTEEKLCHRGRMESESYSG
jgi:hypothetical protein